MPGTHEFGEVSYVLNDCIVAAYNITANTYGTPESLATGQSVTIEFEGDTDSLRGYGVVSRKLTVITGAKAKLGYGALDMSTLAIICGVSNSTSGSAPNRIRTSRWAAGGSGLPYFGLMGIAATDDGGLMVVGVQAIKLDKMPDIVADGKENKFIVNETEGSVLPIAISSVLYVATTKQIETASTWVAPTSGANFLAFFTS